MDYKGEIPHCIHCKQGLARPNIYLFGDGNRFVDDENVTRSQGYVASFSPFAIAVFSLFLGVLS
jgi:hypothetical protein